MPVFTGISDGNSTDAAGKRLFTLRSVETAAIMLPKSYMEVS